MEIKTSYFIGKNVFSMNAFPAAFYIICGVADFP